MFSIDRWNEIFTSIKQHRLRTFLTGFGVFWGIFMLLLLIGVGDGLQRGMLQQFEGYAINSFFVWGGNTSLPYQGMNPGRYIRLSNADLQLIKENIPEIKQLNACAHLSGEFSINYGNNSGSFTIIGTESELTKLENIIIRNGRFLHLLDCQERKKVAVIGRKVGEILFGPENPVGKYIEINGIYFKVVGVFNKPDSQEGGRDPTALIYVPLSCLQQVFNLGNYVGWIGARVRDDAPAQEVEEKAVELLKQRYAVAPKDQNGIASHNSVERFNKTRMLFKCITLFIWMVGLGTIAAGIVGVSNIMLIIVRERTREIGLRKAIGATPGSIVGLILQESVVITSISGYLGLLSAIVTIELVCIVMDKFSLESDFFKYPTIDVKVGIIALFLLVSTGIIAGLIPAYRAAKIDPIEALRGE